MRINITYLVAAFLTISPGVGSPEDLPLSPVCWPLHFAGITLSVNTSSQIDRLLGPGLIVNNGGDITRYYVDLQKRATLRLEFSDSQVEEMTLEKGVSPKLKAADQAKSKWFDPYEGFGNWSDLHLDASKKEVLENLGPPKTGADTDAWEYQSKCACELPEYFTLYFKSDHVVKVVFSAPHG